MSSGYSLGSFPTCVNLWLTEACFSRKFGLKGFEPSGENSYLSHREQ